MVGKVLIIEGTSDETNGSLRKGFRMLLEKKLSGKMPQIIMGDSTKESIDGFLTQDYKGRDKILLIDLDKDESFVDKIITEHKLKDQSHIVCFMIQEMEAWFLSQPDMLDKYYGTAISKKISNKHAKDIPNPDEFLQDVTRKAGKKVYHKVKDGARLLEKLDLAKLETDFKDVEKLVGLLG